MSTLHAAGLRVRGIFDDDVAKLGLDILGAKVIGRTDDALTQKTGSFVLAVGSNEIRKKLAIHLAGLEWVNAIHPWSSIHSTARLGAGTVVCAGAVVQPGVTIGDHCIVNTGATVDHDCKVGDYAHLAPGVHLAGCVKINDGAFLGISACAIPGVRIGEWARVAAGSVVTKDILPFAVVAGVPAREIKNGSDNS